MTNANRPLPYADDVERIPVDEADDIQRVVQALELILASSASRGEVGRAAEFRRSLLTLGNWQSAYSITSTFSRVAAEKPR